MNMNAEGQQKLGTGEEDQELKGVESAMYLGNRQSTQQQSEC